MKQQKRRWSTVGSPASTPSYNSEKEACVTHGDVEESQQAKQLNDDQACDDAYKDDEENHEEQSQREDSQLEIHREEEKLLQAKCCHSHRSPLHRNLRACSSAKEIASEVMQLCRTRKAWG